MKRRYKWNPTGIFAKASAAHIQEWSGKENEKEIEFATEDKFFRGRKPIVDWKKKKSSRKTPWHWLIEDKMADDIGTKQM